MQELGLSPPVCGQLSGSKSTLRGQFEFGVLTAARKAIRNQDRAAGGESSMGALQEQTLISRGH